MRVVRSVLATLAVAALIAMPTAASAASTPSRLSHASSVLTAPVKYANCAALNAVYRHGVAHKGAVDHVSGRTYPVTNFTVNTAVYNANTGRDRDKDGIACEKR
jgi:hypothetical protein